ncbi:MAG: GGDEF domain-containing protein [Thermodesulfobacteriota bacterium]
MSAMAFLDKTSNYQPDQLVPDMSGMMDELKSFRKRNQRLSLLNDLYSRLAASSDLASIIEAFSVWLMPLVYHDLVGYHNPERDKKYLCCSCHGPERIRVISIAENLFQNFSQLEQNCWYEDNYYVHNWYLGTVDLDGLVLVFRSDQVIRNEERELISESLTVLKGSVERALEYEDLFAAAKKDYLTGLANRRVFNERIDYMIDAARRYEHPLSLLALDLDHFKSINDLYGHTEGDNVLIKVTETFAGLVRSSDLLARMGGDEFMLLLPNTDLKAAHILAERLCKAVADLDISVGHGAKLGVSIGLSQWQPGIDKEEWFSLTDEKLYQAKKQGRRRFCSK